MPVEMNRQTAQIQYADKQRDENQSLQPVVGSLAFRETPDLRSDSESQNYVQNENAEEVRNEIQNVFGARKRDRFFVAFARQRVLFGFRRLWRSLLSCRCIRIGRLRRR